MTPGDVVGTLGVTILLISFALTTTGRTAPHSQLCLILNCFGAALACAASILIHFIPFVVLEGLWCLVATATWVKIHCLS
ncbi:MAG: hypothetical protein JSR66_08555 [Proteobacteria bacterium]|nr:hypothetical protein [Pseudomonadota bacterium]